MCCSGEWLSQFLGLLSDRQEYVLELVMMAPRKAMYWIDLTQEWGMNESRGFLSSISIPLIKQ